MSPRTALVAAIRRLGDFGRHTTGDPSVRGSSPPRGIRAAVHRSHSRCTERDSSYGDEVGPSRREPCSRCRSAEAEMRTAEVGADNEPGSVAARCVADASTNDGWVAILSGLRRGELFALRWRDIDEQARLLTVQEAVYDGVFSTPKTETGARQIPLSDTALTLIADWKAYVGNVKPDALMFSTSAGTPILPNNVVRRSIFPACKRLGLPRARLTFRRTYSAGSGRGPAKAGHYVRGSRPTFGWLVSRSSRHVGKRERRLVRPA